MRLLLATFGFMVLLPASASACGTCTLALMWMYFPPALWWVILGILWYLCLVIAASMYRTKLPLILPLWRALVVLALLIVASMMPGIAMILTGFLFTCFVSTFRLAQLRRHYPVALVRIVLMVATVFSLALLGTGIHAALAEYRMDTADKIAKWQGTTTTRLWQKQLADLEPGSAAEYRKLLRIAPLSGEAAESAEQGYRAHHKCGGEDSGQGRRL
jgi:hypothetical protein